jgi:hypothetical protein
MNGAQLLKADSDSSGLMTGPPAKYCYILLNFSKNRQKSEKRTVEVRGIPPFRRGWAARLLDSLSPVPKGEGPGAPSAGVEKAIETGATRHLGHPPTPSPTARDRGHLPYYPSVGWSLKVE